MADRFKRSFKQLKFLSGSKLRNDRVIYARKAGESFDPSHIQDGEKISLETACKLKEVVWGSANMPPKPEWMKQGIMFHTSDHTFAYGLSCPLNGVKNFLMCFQAHVLKNLLFDKKSKAGSVRKLQTSLGEASLSFDQGASNKALKPSAPKKISLTSSQRSRVSRPQKFGDPDMSTMLRPSEKVQQEILVNAFAEVLLKMAEGEEAVFCLPGPDNCFEPTAQFAIDGITEKLRLFKSDKEEELKSIIRRHTSTLQEKNGLGVLSLLYSAILSRNPDRVFADLQDQSNLPLIDPMGECTLPLMTLMITGKATPYLHNGIVSAEGDEFEGTERVGITSRNEIGLLLFEKDDETTLEFGLGSRLKTPVLPIWISRCNGKLGVLFNTNRELMRSYHAENRFQLHYYSDHEVKKETLKETILTIDINSKRSNGQIDPAETEFDETPIPPLEKAIQTKWEGCEVDWNGSVPFI